MYDPNDQEVHADRYLFRYDTITSNSRRDARTILCGQQRWRRRSGDGLDQEEKYSKRLATRRNRRGGRPSFSTPMATGPGRDVMWSPNNRPTRKGASGSRRHFMALRRALLDGSIWGSVVGFPGAVARLNPGGQPPGNGWRNIYELPLDKPVCPFRVTRREEWTSTATASSGHRSQAGISLASTGGSARARSSARRRRGNTARKAGPLPISGTAVRKVTGSGSAEASYYTWVDQHDTFGLGNGTYRLPPAMRLTPCSPWSTENSLSFACPIRWASMPKAWTAASTT